MIKKIAALHGSLCQPFNSTAIFYHHTKDLLLNTMTGKIVIQKKYIIKVIVKTELQIGKFINRK